MKKLDIFLVRSYLGPFILTFFIALFILVMQFLWKYVDDLVGKGLEWYVIAELLMYASASLVPLALPLAILLSSIMCFGNLGEKYELAALKSSGVSLRRIMLPLAAASVLISAGAFYFSNNLLPVSNLKMQSLLFDVQQKRPALNIKPGAFYGGIEGYVIRVSEKYDGGGLRDIMIYDHTGRLGNAKLVTADSGKMALSADERYLIVTLYRGRAYEEMDKDARRRSAAHPFMRSTFAEAEIRFDLSSFAFMRTDEDLFRDKYTMLNMRQLVAQTDTLERRLEERRSEFGVNLANSYYRRMRIADTATAAVSTPVAEHRDVLKNFDKPLRLKILDIAMNMVRSAHAYAEITRDDIEIRQKNIIRHHIELHRKFSLSVACIVLFFIGAPMGAIIRKGGLGLPVVVSVGFFLLYYVTSITGEKFAREGILPPSTGMWISTAILLPIGIFLTRKATSDSVLLNTEAYVKFINSVLKLKHYLPAAPSRSRFGRSTAAAQRRRGK